MGNEKKKLLRSLPEKLKGVIQFDTYEDIQKLWKVFHCTVVLVINIIIK